MCAINVVLPLIMLTLVSDCPRQPENGVRHESNEREDQDFHENEWHAFADDRDKGLLRHICDDEKQQPERRGKQAKRWFPALAAEPRYLGQNPLSRTRAGFRWPCRKAALGYRT